MGYLLMELLDDLNASQLRAVEQDTGELLIFAGPGSGKTRVLTARMAYFVLGRGYSASRLRAVTFTRTATTEMYERLKGYGVKGVVISTLHGLAREVISHFHRSHQRLVQICRASKLSPPVCWVDGMGASQLPVLSPLNVEPFRLTPAIGLRLALGHVAACLLMKQKPSVRIRSMQDGFGVAELLEKKSGLPDAMLRQFWERVSGYISLMRLKMYVGLAFGQSIHANLDPEALGEIKRVLGTFLEHVSVPFTDFFESVARTYKVLLEARGLLDYTDQLLWAHQILRNDTETLMKAQGLYDAYFVDEFQDTDPVQFDTLRMLSLGHRQLTVVGDPNQAIYGFRGADVEGILRFQEVFGDASCEFLETNYRSTSEIVAASYAVVDAFQRPEWLRCKALRSGVGVRFIADLRAVDAPASDICILTRTNKRVIEVGRILRAAGIAYKYSTRQSPAMYFAVPKWRVEPVLDVLRVAEALDNDKRLAAAIPHLKGVGPKTLAKLPDVDRLRKHPKIRAFLKWLSHGKPSVAEIRESPLLKLNLGDMLPEEVAAETVYLGKLLDDAKACPSYETLLSASASVRTIHSAKGLEFPTVVVDMKGFAPYDETEAELENESRVLYVAMSRAKEQLYLLGRNRQMFPNVRALQTFIEL